MRKRRNIRLLAFLLIVAITTSALPVYAAGQDSWDKASPYMISDLREAQSLGLIPDNIIGADFTKPISRAEFAHLIVLMCEAYTGVTTEPQMLAGNPFTDTDDQAVFKAYGFSIMDAANEEGTLFSPNDPIDRETMAVMVYRAIRLIAPLADYAVPVTPVIPDKEKISEWAVPAVQYLYSQGIVTGGAGHVFMPRPAGSEQLALGYGIATREQCVAVAVRVWNQLPKIQNTRFQIENKAAEILDYAMEEPQGGTVIERDELIAILRPYANKIRWADNTHALSFLGDLRKTGDGEWEQGYDSSFLYSAVSIKGLDQYKYDEEQTLWGRYAGWSRFALNSFDDEKKLHTSYEWDSTSGTGVKYEIQRQSMQLFSPLSLRDYIPGRLDWEYVKYDDAIINNERCIVFSATWVENLIQSDVPPGSGEPPEHLADVTEYYYISTVSGLCIVNKLFGANADTTYQTLQIIFSITPSLADLSAIVPPADIVFS